MTEQLLTGNELGPNYLQITSRQRVLRSCSRQYFQYLSLLYYTTKGVIFLYELSAGRQIM